MLVGSVDRPDSVDYRQRRLITSYNDLLPDFAPYLRYHSTEMFFADSPAEATDHVGNVLERADTAPPTLLANHGETTGALLGASLSLNLLDNPYTGYAFNASSQDR